MITRWAADLVPAEVISLPEEEDRPAAAADEPPAPKKLQNVNIPLKYRLKQLSGSNTANGSNSTSTTPHQTAKRQMEMYLSYDHGEIEVNSEGVPIEINPIRFWSDNAQKMPALSKLALRVLAVPASSAPVERIFSHGGIIFRPHRRRLSDQNLAQLIFLKCNRLKLNLE